MKKIALFVVMATALMLCMGHGGCRSGERYEAWRQALTVKVEELTAHTWMVKEVTTVPTKYDSYLRIIIESQDRPELREELMVEATMYYEDYHRLIAGDVVKFEVVGKGLSKYSDLELSSINLDDLLRPIRVLN